MVCSLMASMTMMAQQKVTKQLFDFVVPDNGDIREAFAMKYGRYPTEGQLRDCVENVKDSALEDLSIECGWEVINEVLI